jgi:hypothetical protein
MERRRRSRFLISISIRAGERERERERIQRGGAETVEAQPEESGRRG